MVGKPIMRRECLMCGRSAGCDLWFGQPVVVQGAEYRSGSP